MSDIDIVVNAIQQSGPGAATTVGGLWALKRVLGPSIDEVGTKLAEVTRRRIDNLAKIGAKAERLNSSETAYPQIRVTQRVLNDATLYDDNVQQTYVAGLLAGSRNDDGSDDRPIFYLTVIDGLTASQLRLFHVLYSAVALANDKVASHNGPVHSSIGLSVDEVNANLRRLAKTNDARESLIDLFALEHVGLIKSMGMNGGRGADAELSFWATPIGAVLYDWAYGFNDDDINKFGFRDRPNIGLPEMLFSNY